MARRCVMLGVLGVALGFQLRVPLKLETKMLRAPTTEHTTSKPWPVSSSTRSSIPEQEGAVLPVQAQEEGSGEGERLDWAKQWYPMLAEKSTDPGRTHAVQLLGKHLVVWRNGEGTWAAFEDRCPHRAAPLTEGRVEKDGTLLCAYHGWRFDSDGKCLKIPQSDRGGKDEAQAAACANVYPTQVVQGMVWVWGDNGRDAGLESALTPPLLLPELHDAEAVESGRVVHCALYQRDLAYGWETLLENLMDPAHTVVSHHGITGKREQASPITFESGTPVLGKGGFSLAHSPPYEGSGAVSGVIEFCAPILMQIGTTMEDGNTMKLGIYGVPTRPGWTRIISCQIFIAAKGSKASETKKIIRTPGGVKPQHLPDWFQHLIGNIFLDQDMALLHHQEKILDSDGYKSSNYHKAVYTPTDSDKGSITMRRWLAKHAPDGPPWAKGCDTTMPPRETNRDELFNIYERHTKTCTSCLGALKRVNQLLPIAKASAAASFGWAILRGARAVGVSASPSASLLNFVTARAMLPGLATMFASLGSIKVLKLIKKSLKAGNYSHQDNN